VKVRLETRGYIVDTQVGVSGYRIDLGVCHPDRPGHYLAGVECDGARYHSAKSARDRDRLREQVLADLGWTILRVWSTDWFADPDRETDKLVRRIDELLRRKPPPAPAFALNVGPSRYSVLEVPAEETPDGNSDEIVLAEAPATPVTSEFLDSDTPPSSGEAQDLLVKFREIIIRPKDPNWQPQRSILRDAMIETIVTQRLDDPEDWFGKVPSYLRQATKPTEKRYLEQICGIVARILIEPNHTNAGEPAHGAVVTDLNILGSPPPPVDPLLTKH